MYRDLGQRATWETPGLCRFGETGANVQNPRSLRRLHLASLAAVFALAVLIASGCGGGDDSVEGAPPDQFAADVCGAISSWQNEIQAEVSAMSAELSATSTPAEIKEQLVDFMESATKATDQMLAKVKEAGPPAVEDGEALQRDLEAGLERAQTAFSQARDRAKSLPTGDRAAFQREASALGTTLNEQGTAIGQTFNGLSDKYDSNELNTAFDNDPACRNL